MQASEPEQSGVATDQPAPSHGPPQVIVKPVSSHNHDHNLDHDHDQHEAHPAGAGSACETGRGIGCGHAHRHSADEPAWKQFASPVGCLALLIVAAAIDYVRVAPGAAEASMAPTNWLPADGLGWLVLFLWTGCYAFGGLSPLWEGLRSLLRGETSIDLLMVLAAIGSAAIGHVADGALLLFLFSLSHSLEHFVLGRTRRAVADLVDLTPESAQIRTPEGEQTVPAEALRPGQELIVRPGDRIATDGLVLEGQSAVDQAPVTGESMPVEKHPGDLVYAGSLNQLGRLVVRVTSAVQESSLARLVRLVEQTEANDARSQSWSRWFGRTYSLAVIVLTLLVLMFGWLVLHEGFAHAFLRAMTVLVSASPCALVLSIPAAVLSAIAGAARSGVLFKGGRSLEAVARIKCFAFDKTGTLTLGRPSVIGMFCESGVEESQLLADAAAIEYESEHPLAKALVDLAIQRQLPRQQAEQILAAPGQSIRGTIDGRTLEIGRLENFLERGDAASLDLLTQAAQWRDRGAMLVALTRPNLADSSTGGSTPGAVQAIMAVADGTRPTAVEAIAQLRALRLQPLMILTGDNLQAAQRIAQPLGLEVRAELLPEEKLACLRELQRTAGPVAMIGDGLNDAPALAAADVGFSLGGTATDVALETADVVILGGDLTRLPYSVRLARSAQAIIRQNIVIAAGTMIVLLFSSLAAVLPLPVAVLGHEGSTVLVVLNSVRLLRRG